MYHTGLDPFTGPVVHVARHMRDRKLHRALLPFFRPETYFEDRKVLQEAGGQDLIGSGCDAWIPAQPLEAPEERRQQANPAARGDYVREIRNPERHAGYRRGRKLAPGQRKKGIKGANQGRRDEPIE